MLAFSNDYYGMIFRATQSVELFCAYDESVDVEKIVETQMMIEAVRSAITRLNAEERDIIERLYFNDETVRSVAKLKSITHPALIKRRNKILEKLKKFIEEL